MFNVGKRVDTVWVVSGFVFDAFSKVTNKNLTHMSTLKDYIIVRSSSPILQRPSSTCTSNPLPLKEVSI